MATTRAAGQKVAGLHLGNSIIDGRYPIFVGTSKDPPGQRLLVTRLPNSDINNEGIPAEHDTYSKLVVDELPPPLYVERDDEYTYLVQQHAPTDVRQALRDGDKLAARDAVDFISQLCVTLNPAHQSGIAHGMLAPGRLLRSSDGRVYIAGLGLARLLSHEPTNDAREAAFRAPEEMWDPRRDVFSLGRLLLYLLTGNQETYLDWSRQSDWAGEPGTPELSRQLASFPEPLQDLLRRTLAKNGEERPANCSEVRLLIERSGLASRPGDSAFVRPRSNDRIVAANVLVLLTLPLLALFVALLPRRTPVFSSDTPDGRIAATAMTLPGRDTGWWADEENGHTLLPVIRALITDRKLNTGTLGELDAVHALSDREIPDQWKAVAELLAQGNAAGAQFRERLEHLAEKLPMDVDPPSLHTRAVLFHKLSAVSDIDFSASGLRAKQQGEYSKRADDAYNSALKEYPWHMPGLRALCYSDYSRFLEQEGRSIEAEEALVKAREILDEAYLSDRLQTSADNVTQLEQQNLPVGVRRLAVSILVRLLNLARDEGAWSRADTLLAEAQLVAGVGDDEASRLQAFLQERAAWYFMDRWRVLKARENFEAASEARFLQAEDDERSLLLYFHDRHGVAMTYRYASEPTNASNNASEAAEMYAQILGRLEQLLRVLDDGNSRHTTLDALKSRLVNSAERRADCILFGPAPGDSVDAFDRALLEVERQTLLTKPAEGEVARLHFKKALALALRGDVDRGREAFAEGERIAPRKPAPEGSAQTEGEYRDARLWFVRTVVQAVMDYQRDQAGMALFESLRDEFLRMDQLSLISRDELDLLLLAARQLPTPDGSPEEELSPEEKLACQRFAELNIALARLPQGRPRRNLAILTYVRPSYEHAMQMYCRLGDTAKCEELKKESGVMRDANVPTQ